MRTMKKKLAGVIRFGGGINVRHWVEEAKKKGFVILLQDNHCLFFKKELK